MASQLTTFKLILASIQHHEEPFEILRPSDEKVELVGWGYFIQLSVFRSILGNGFITHFVVCCLTSCFRMQHNPVLIEALSLESARSNSSLMSRNAEKRFARDHEKERWMDRTKDRNSKHASQFDAENYE